MELLGLVVVVVMLILIGIGIAIGLVACGVGAVLLGVGVISSSVFVAIRSGRTAAGIRAFLLQCGLFSGILAGAVCAWLVQAIFEGQAGDWRILAYGALGGACVGLLIGYLLDVISQRLHAWASTRLLAPRPRPVHETSRSSGRYGISRRKR